MMAIPGEGIIASLINKYGDRFLQKLEESEKRRDREFAYKLKELEFYKSNYDKEIKKIFDSWFGLLQNLLIISNTHVSQEAKRHYQKELDRLLMTENLLELKIQTMKYCGTETGKVLALYSQISYDSVKEGVELPKLANVYAICMLLSTMKLEILGQVIEPLSILKILLNDYEEEADVVNEARAYVSERKTELFGEE